MRLIVSGMLHPETRLGRLTRDMCHFGLGAGLAGWALGHGDLAEIWWILCTLPLCAMLLIQLLRKGVGANPMEDMLTLASIVAALWLEEPLAAILLGLRHLWQDLVEGQVVQESGLLDPEPLPDMRHPSLRKAGAYIEHVDAHRIAPGDEVLVAPGAIVPVDGVLTDRIANLDSLPLTGLKTPLSVRIGGLVQSGSINVGSTIRMKASGRLEDGTYASMVRFAAIDPRSHDGLVPQAAVLMQLVPVVFIAAALATAYLGDHESALSVLIFATLVPLGTVPRLMLLAALAGALRCGIPVRGSDGCRIVRDIARARAVIFDKTGIVTEGGSTLLEIATPTGGDPDRALGLLASLEQASNHRMADAILAAAEAKGLYLSKPEETRMVRGTGISGLVDGRRLDCGTRAYVLGESPLPLWAERCLDRYHDQPVLTVYVAADTQLEAIVVLSDALRTDARSTVEKLRSSGIDEVTLVTSGDRYAAARIEAALGLDRSLSEADHAEKEAMIVAASVREPTIVVADQLRDDHLLSRGTVAVAVARPAMAPRFGTADAIVISGRLAPVASLVALSKSCLVRTRSIMSAGLAAALIAAGIAAFGYVSPVIAVFIRVLLEAALLLAATLMLRQSIPL